MAGDPYWDSVVLAMHMDDAGLTDLKGHAVTLNGNAARSSTQSKFGGYSAAFDGTGDYLTTPDSTAWALGTGDFTIEAWVYRNVIGATHRVLALRSNGNTSDLLTFGINNTDQVAIAAYTSGAAITTIKSAATVGSGVWVHIAATRIAGVVKLWVGGVNNDTVTTNLASAYPDMAVPLTIGRGYYDLDSETFNGYIDDLRVTKGIARYTADFTPPTAAFLEYAGQISGTVRDDTNAFCARTVRAYRRSNGVLSGSTVSNSTTGEYTINTPTLDAHTVIALDDDMGTSYNAIILDNINPV